MWCHGVVDRVVFSHRSDFMNSEIFLNLLVLWLCESAVPLSHYPLSHSKTTATVKMSLWPLPTACIPGHILTGGFDFSHHTRQSNFDLSDKKKIFLRLSILGQWRVPESKSNSIITGFLWVLFSTPELIIMGFCGLCTKHMAWRERMYFCWLWENGKQPKCICQEQGVIASNANNC